MKTTLADLRQAVTLLMEEHDEETTGDMSFDHLINVAMAHECTPEPSSDPVAASYGQTLKQHDRLIKEERNGYFAQWMETITARDEALAEVARWQAIATRAVEALRSFDMRTATTDDWFRCPGPPTRRQLELEAVLATFDAAGSTTTLEIARAEDRAELLFHVVCLIRGEKDPLDVLLGHELSRRDERIAREAREAALNAAFAGVLDIVRTEHGCNPSTKSRLVVRLAVISGALAKKATP